MKQPKEQKMLNVVVPMAGKSSFFSDKEFQFPKPLIEIEGRMMIDRVIDSLKRIPDPKRFVFVINESDATQYHLDNVIKLLTDQSSIVVYQRAETKGAICSVLLGIEHINSEAELVISNADSVLECDLSQVLQSLRERNADAGTLCFESVHPQWSYVMADEKQKIIEAAEKRPISKNAIAGFYYFKRGRDFVSAAMNCIEKDVQINGRFFISHTFNELILDGKELYMVKVPNDKYHSFYSPDKVKLYERHLAQLRQKEAHA